MTETSDPPSVDTKQAGKVAQALVVGGAAKPEGELASSPWRLVAIAAGLLAVGWFAGWGLLLMIVALVIMIFLHEVGHFVTAKWAGMKVTEFCILGIGPKVWSIRRGETEYMVRAIPIAAYVRIIGMNNLDECDPADEARTFRQQSFPKRLLVMSGGSLMHFVQAIVLFLLVFTLVGVPGDSDLAQDLGGPVPAWGVLDPIAGGPADEAGIEPGDQFVSVDGRPVTEPADIRPILAGKAGATIPVVVSRDGAEQTLRLTLAQHPDLPGAGFLGVELGRLRDAAPPPDLTFGPIQGFTEAISTTGHVTWQTLDGLGHFATGGLADFVRTVVGRDEEPVGPGVVGGSGSGAGAGGGSVRDVDESRPVSILGIAHLGAEAAESDFGQVLLLLAVVNISIGLINLLPLLPFDGGHIAIAVYERIRSRGGRRHMADVSRLLPLTYAVVLLLGFLMVSSMYLDIVDPIAS